jgi:gliding motility-associated-like protein
MPKIMKSNYIHHIGLSFFMCASLFVVSQNVLYNQGSVFVANGGVMHVNGNTISTGVGTTLINQGSFTAANSINNGDFEINNNATVSGDGNYLVENNWINNATFTANQSEVTLNGNNQLITGTVVTTFHDLTLTGTGVKTQTIDANIDASGTLNLNDRELATDVNTMFVLNPAANAITNSTAPGSEGFVSSLAPGTLSRVTNSTSVYPYPVGSSVAVTRYRPVEITPNDVNTANYTVRFINHNPDIDGYDRNINDGLICQSNDTFYHAILRTTGTTAADIRLHYIVGTDGNYDGMAHWRTNNNQWNDMASTTPGIAGIFTTLTRSAWQFANPGEPYLLTEQSPLAPTISGDTILCIGSTSTTFTASGGNGNYIWTVPSGVIITDSTNNSITVNWNTGPGTVTVISVSQSGGCNSAPASLNINVFVGPSAFGYSDTNNVFSNHPILFTDTSQGNPISWHWDFGDGNSSTVQNPWHSFNAPGTYQVVLTVVDSNGCADTAHIWIEIIDGILIPNVFSPNGDGSNDVFYISGGGFEEFEIKIFNRWGSMMFEAKSPQVAWDGRTNAGLEVSAGTYYFTLVAKSKTNDFSTTGYITVFK